jgi:Gas vesicle protein K
MTDCDMTSRDHGRDREGSHDTAPGVRPGARQRITMDRESVERDLTALVLTVIELLRQLMERQALRRIDEGGLSDEQVESLGLTLMALEERMTELREHFGLSPDDLNIDLGPLGPLLPRDD